jgi:hypothetical protein
MIVTLATSQNWERKRGKTTSLSLENEFLNEWLALAKGYCNTKLHER